MLFPCISLDETLNFKRLYIDNSNLLNEKVYLFQKHYISLKNTRKSNISVNARLTKLNIDVTHKFRKENHFYLEFYS